MPTQKLEGKGVEERMGEAEREKERERKSTRMWERKGGREREKEHTHAGERGREPFGSSFYMFSLPLGLPCANWA